MSESERGHVSEGERGHMSESVVSGYSAEQSHSAPRGFTTEQSQHASRGFTTEQARRGGERSAAVRRAQAKLRAEARAKRRFESVADRMAGVLISAALGKDEFAALEPEKRAQFALKCLEYGIGRPRPVEPERPEERREQGLSIHVAESLDEVPEALATALSTETEGTEE